MDRVTGEVESIDIRLTFHPPLPNNQAALAAAQVFVEQLTDVLVNGQSVERPAGPLAWGYGSSEVTKVQASRFKRRVVEQ